MEDFLNCQAWVKPIGSGCWKIHGCGFKTIQLRISVKTDPFIKQAKFTAKWVLIKKTACK